MCSIDGLSSPKARKSQTQIESAKGHIEQLDLPEEIYNNPRTVFAATFVGTSNHFNGLLKSASEGLCQVNEQMIHVPLVLSFPAGACQVLPVDKEAVELEKLAEAAEEKV